LNGPEKRNEGSFTAGLAVAADDERHSDKKDTAAPTSTADQYGDKLVYAVVRDIYMSASFGEGKVKVVMQLPLQSQADSETLTLAVQLILEKYFKLLFSPSEMMHLRAGRSVKFIEEGMLELPPRRVSILLAAEQRILEVEGKPPEDGRNAYTDLVFAWQKQSGALDERGRSFTSRAFATQLERFAGSGKKRICFIVGGAYGLAPELKARADMVLALSSMVMPHDMARLVLAEQLYRAFTILRGEPYSH